jgi:hypothetical protein
VALEQRLEGAFVLRLGKAFDELVVRQISGGLAGDKLPEVTEDRGERFVRHDPDSPEGVASATILPGAAAVVLDFSEKSAPLSVRPLATAGPRLASEQAGTNCKFHKELVNRPAVSIDAALSG